MTELITQKHHLSGQVITGFGVENFKKNYNAHTMNETSVRDEKHFIPDQVTEKSQIIEFVNDSGIAIKAKVEPKKKEDVAPKVKKNVPKSTKKGFFSKKA